MYNIDIMPSTPEEWEILINAKVREQQEIYDTACQQTRAAALAQWEKLESDRTAELVRAVQAEISSRRNADGAPLTEEQKAALFDEASRSIADLMAREKREFISNAASAIAQPQTRQEIERTYDCYYPHQEEPELSTQSATSDAGTAIYQLADGRLYDVASGEILKASGADPGRVIVLPIGTEADLRETLQCYGLPVPAFLCGAEELFDRLRAERDARIAATDYLLTPDYPITQEKREAVSAYRTALRDLPAREGAPWDGGGPATPWPVMAEVI